MAGIFDFGAAGGLFDTASQRVGGMVEKNPMALLAASSALLSGEGWGGGMRGFMQGAMLDQQGRRQDAQDQMQQQLFQQRQTLFDQEQEERKSAQAQANRTQEWFRRNAPEYADAPMEVQKEVIKSLFTGQKPTGDMQEYEFARQQGFSGSFMDYQSELKKAGATNVTVGGGKYGTIPQGYMLQEGADGARLVPIPGGPAEAEMAKVQSAAQAKQEQGQRTGNIITQDIDRAISMINESPMLTTGVGGQLLSSVGGTSARDVSGLLDTVKANAGFDKLQAMRDASPTGGALGQVTERELALLQAAIGSLEQSQSQRQLVENLVRVRAIYSAIIDGPQGMQQGGGAQSGGRPSGGYRILGVE